MDDMLQEGLRLRKLGFAIHWLRPSTKIPVSSGWADASVMDAAALKSAYQPRFNVGFRPGKWSVVNGKEICVLDVDIRGGARYAEEAYAAAAAMMRERKFTVISGSDVGRHRYLGFDKGTSPPKAATTLRQSDIWVNNDTKDICASTDKDARPAWLIEILSTGKNVVMPPSIHPDTGHPYKFDIE
ncbi:bifunctional DNA primase/polymerase [Rhodoferax sp. PAMC 29310]|uniref:bifunctional DNA primase/polymerase n=1 Tax=Rhodoferax sp. PAMC 29310 TaxID=2822760 RepID=UPI001B337A50|nr:bifunctional DNA primase/polymerase [Rhodoferax sp. PAMC 29310]